MSIGGGNYKLFREEQAPPLRVVEGADPYKNRYSNLCRALLKHSQCQRHHFIARHKPPLPIIHHSSFIIHQTKKSPITRLRGVGDLGSKSSTKNLVLHEKTSSSKKPKHYVIIFTTVLALSLSLVAHITTNLPERITKAPFAGEPSPLPKRLPIRSSLAPSISSRLMASHSE